MAYREVTMIEVKEVLRLWFAGTATKRIAAMLGLDPKTVRRYLRIAREAGVVPEAEGGGQPAVRLACLAVARRGRWPAEGERRPAAFVSLPPLRLRCSACQRRLTS